jgi:hydroxymethylbilane synthase
LSPEEFVPPPGQGAMAVEIRADDERMAELVSLADHSATTAAVSAERSFLEALGGGCQVPVGAYAEADGNAGNTLRLTVFMASADGSVAYRASVVGPVSDTVALSATGWERLREQGAAGLLE